MKIRACLMTSLLIVSVLLGPALRPSTAQSASGDPVVTLAVENHALGDVLEMITNETGYRFNLSESWQGFPVSANIDALPLEQALNRLLRSLNHTLVWESDKVVTVTVFGEVKPGDAGPGISYASPPNPVPEVFDPEEAYEESEAYMDVPEDEEEIPVEDDPGHDEEMDEQDPEQSGQPGENPEEIPADDTE